MKIFLLLILLLPFTDGNAQRLNGSYSSNTADVSTLTFNDKKSTFQFSGAKNETSFTDNGTYTTLGNSLFLLFGPEDPGMPSGPRKPIVEKISDMNRRKIKLDSPGVYHIRVFCYSNRLQPTIYINKGQTWTMQITGIDGNNDYIFEETTPGALREFIQRVKTGKTKK